MSNSLITEALAWDTLRCLHKVNNHLAAAASEIEELGIEAGHISQTLEAEFGITIWKLRDICDFMHKVEVNEYANAQKFEDYLNGKLTRQDMELPLEYYI